MRQFDDDLLRDLNGLLTDEQKGRPAGMVGMPTMMTLISKTVTYWVLGVGVLLILGLFTRCASIAGALFLLSVVATQPPWVAGCRAGLLPVGRNDGTPRPGHHAGGTLGWP